MDIICYNNRNDTQCGLIIKEATDVCRQAQNFHPNIFYLRNAEPHRKDEAEANASDDDDD